MSDAVLPVANNSTNVKTSFGLPVTGSNRPRKKYAHYSVNQVPLLMNSYLKEDMTITEAARRQIKEVENSKTLARTYPIKEDLCNAFPGLDVSITILTHPIQHKYNLTMKKAEPYREPRDAPEVRVRRRGIIRPWIADPCFGPQRNCVFIDESGFNSHLWRTFARSKHGQPARIRVPIERGRNKTLLAAISHPGLMDLSVKVSPGGTRWQNFAAYIHIVMDALDREGCQR
ncbi:hypothetical protein DFQ30_002095 [Apophysomyces sp. BC1015]|nr:hypothetical protein DFQ30_002095 [Apophysomyces sp. BC1015]